MEEKLKKELNNLFGSVKPMEMFGVPKLKPKEPEYFYHPPERPKLKEILICSECKHELKVIHIHARSHHMYYGVWCETCNYTEKINPNVLRNK